MFCIYASGKVGRGTSRRRSVAHSQPSLVWSFFLSDPLPLPPPPLLPNRVPSNPEHPSDIPFRSSQTTISFLPSKETSVLSRLFLLLSHPHPRSSFSSSCRSIIIIRSSITPSLTTTLNTISSTNNNNFLLSELLSLRRREQTTNPASSSQSASVSLYLSLPSHLSSLQPLYLPYSQQLTSLPFFRPPPASQETTKTRPSSPPSPTTSPASAKSPTSRFAENGTFVERGEERCGGGFGWRTRRRR